MSLTRVPDADTYVDLDEKIHALTQESSLYKEYHVVGAVGHARGGCLDFNQAIDGIISSVGSREEQDISIITNMEIYTDNLVATAPVRLGNFFNNLTIISRAISTDSHLVDIQLGKQERFTVQLYCAPSQSPITFRVTFSDGSTTEATVDPRHLAPGHRFWGLSLDRGTKGSADSVDEADTLAGYFKNSSRSIADRIQDDGELERRGWDSYNNNLRPLLNYQLMLASRFQDNDKILSCQLAEFVAFISQGIADAFDLYSQAGGIVMSKAVGQGSSTYALVPKLDLSTAQQVLDSRLDAAAAFDSACRDLQGQSAASANVRLFANIALERSVDSDSVYSFMTKTAGGRLSNAQLAFHKGQLEFQNLQLMFKTKQDEFKAGIESWKKAQTMNIIGEVLTAIAAVAGSIALACVAPPAGAAGIAAGAGELGSAISKAEKVVSIFQRFQKAVRSIEKVVEKIKPFLDKMLELVDAIKKIISIVKQQESMDDMNDNDVAKLKLPTVTGNDAINITADWDCFQVEMNNLYEGIKDENIGGAEGFFTLITKMVIRGKAVFAAQTALAVASDAYLTVMQQQIAQKANTIRLRKALSSIQGNERAFAIIKLAMAERLLALRTWINLDFLQYLAVYVWNSPDSKRPITLDPLKDMGSFRTDAATLQALSAQVYAQARSQTRIFRLSYKRGDLLARIESGEYALPQAEDILSVLKQSREASFTLNYESPLFRRFGRFRLSKARMFLDNAKAEDEADPVSLRITLGTAMKDLGVDKVKESGPPLPDIDASRVLHFVTTESTFGFEYAGKDNEVLLEGAFCGYFESSSLLMSPFRPWTVSVESDANLDAVTDITLELECQVTYV